MRREVAGGYEVDDDRGRVDVDMVYRYLSEEAYWVPGRDRATIERLVRESTRVIGVYLGDQQVGFARVISDGTSVAWLGDVFVLAEHRGKGLGEELVREAVEHPIIATSSGTSTRATRTRLYAKFGFEAPSEGTMVRPKRRLIDREGDPPVGRRREARGKGPRPPRPNRGARR